MLEVPAKAGIRRLHGPAPMKPWIPAFAGMTVELGAAWRCGWRLRWLRFALCCALRSGVLLLRVCRA
ncbi:hypothetical protein [Lysobacter gummosus]|uniref:hypothetical protein n=1 Tax=Lysobacter gummosus TaxID=262324 RepID=UPI0036254F0A